MPDLKLSDLASGLEEFGDRYHALDVFLHDVEGSEQLMRGEIVDGIEPVDDQVAGEALPCDTFRFRDHGKAYRLRMFRELGVARVTREPGLRAEVLAGAAIGGAMGGVVGATAGARPQNQEMIALAGMVLGLLVGATLAGAVAGARAPRRVFALRFEPEAKEWRAYDGGLVRWMKERLAPPEAIEGIGVEASAVGA